ncbi:MAG: hypothetical protein IJ681_05530 [Bacteroidales bacterium]|nr:hypothetical protein [Bacteroidales bacterium]
MKKSIFILSSLVIGLLFAVTTKDVNAQTDDGLKITGYVQAQAEYAGKDALKVWTGAYDADKYDNNDHFLTFGVRRGRIRATYSKNQAKLVIEFNTSESGVTPIKAYMGWDALPWLSVQAGLLNSFFGDELMYLSPLQETMDRTYLTHMMFPGLHEIGLKAIFKAPAESDFKGLKLELAAVSGNGISKTPDGRIALESHLKYDRTTQDGFMKWGVGLSYYNGKVNNADSIFYTFENNAWQGENVGLNKKNKREYLGLDGQLTFFNDWGRSNLRGEYIFGTQPSVKNGFEGAKNNQYNKDNAFSYNRKFQGYYLYYVQDLGRSKWQTVLKASYCDFNKDANGDNAATKFDLSYQNYGFGLIFNPTKNVRLSAFYDWYINEESQSVIGYNKQVPNDVLTVRMQVSF